MKYKNILITGGAGFVGSNIAVALKNSYNNIEVVAFDNLYRKGSELNVPRIESHGVKFIKGDIRNKSELILPKIDLIVECSAEPSVTAGVYSSPEYLIDTNLGGAINCFELARKNQADVIFLSTSRVYPIDSLGDIKLTESKTRFELAENQTIVGISAKGISERFPLEGKRSMYGATKLSSELLLTEYMDSYGIKGIINRFGVIAGPWQFGKSDQGIVAHWLFSFLLDKNISYIGFGGRGKQVRDVLHVDDVVNLILYEINHMEKYSTTTWNAGGGVKNSVSLQELTVSCQNLTNKKINIGTLEENRKNDVPLYITDNTKVRKETGWMPIKSLDNILVDTWNWMSGHKNELEKVLA